MDNTMFSLNELLELSIRIEQNGNKFYLDAAQAVEDQSVQLLLFHLADEELEHLRIFQNMLKDMALETTPPEDEAFSGEQHAFLIAYADHIQFETSLSREGKENPFQGLRSSLRFALKQETESIQFYQELLKLLPVDRHPVLEQIIQEEKKHFTKLAGLLKSM